VAKHRSFSKKPLRGTWIGDIAFFNIKDLKRFFKAITKEQNCEVKITKGGRK